MEALPILVLISAVCASATVGALIGESRAGRTQGMLLGLFLGPLGWLIAVMSRPVDHDEVQRLRGRRVHKDFM